MSRIAIDATSIPPRFAGAGRYIRDLVHALSEIDTANRYFIFTRKVSLRQFTELGANFNLISIPNFSRAHRILWQLYAPQHLCKRLGIEVWHAPHYFLPRNLKHVRKVVTFHDMTFFLQPKLYDPIRRTIFRRMIRHATAHADTVVAVSNSTRADVERCRLTPRKLVTIYSGVGGAFLQQPDSMARQTARSRLSIQGPFILSVGTIEKRKNLVRLLRAFHSVWRNNRPELKLVHVGAPGNGYDELQDEIRRLNLTDAVVLPGYVAEEVLPALYADAELLVYPSLYEGFGFPVLEAMSCGAPVITSDVGATAEIAGDAAITLSPYDVEGWSRAICEVLNDRDLRTKMVMKGRRRAARYPWQQTAAGMLAIYSPEASQQVRDDTGVATPTLRKRSLVDVD